VAVRSSATVEDLPGLSFAGQQETFLDVRGQTALLEAIRRAWASLWTARALAYRAQMGVDHGGLAMALVIQTMVPADVSGVLFTANPSSGDRGELVINAAPGLGEAVVSGTVTPDTYIVARSSLETTSVTRGDCEEPGVPARFNAQVRNLATLALRVEQEFGGTSQDIEWALANGRLWLLQARPITTLPTPAVIAATWESPMPGTTWVRRQVVEHMPEPLSPLFAELYLQQGLQQSIEVIGAAMGVKDLFDQILDGPFFTTVHGYGYSRGNFKVSRESAPLMVRAFVGGPVWLFRHGVAYWREAGLPPYLATIARWQDVDAVTAADAELLRGVRELAVADAVYWFAAVIAIGTAKVSDSILDGLLRLVAPERQLHSSHFLRGFPSKTLEAEAELDAIADWVTYAHVLPGSDRVTAEAMERLLG
jgi:pyruvate,water dikinase